MKIEININGCGDCPKLKSGKTFGTDGRDGWWVYYCDNGAFGRKSDQSEYGCSSGKTKIPTIPPKGCPYFESDDMELLSQDLNISVSELKNLFDKYNIKY